MQVERLRWIKNSCTDVGKTRKDYAKIMRLRIKGRDEDPINKEASDFSPVYRILYYECADIYLKALPFF